MRYRVELEELLDFVDRLQSFEQRAESLAAQVDRQIIGLHAGWSGGAAAAHRARHDEWTKDDHSRLGLAAAGLLTRGQTKAKYGHWAVPGWAPAPDGGMYWILPDDMSAYDPWRYHPNDPARPTWQAWVLHTDGRPPVQLVRDTDDKSSESAYHKVIAPKNAWYADRDDIG